MSNKIDVSEAVYFLLAKALRVSLVEALAFGVTAQEIKTLLDDALKSALSDRREEVERYEQGH